MRAFKKLSLLALISLVACSCFWFISVATTARLPSSDHALLFYSNQTRQDLKLLFSHAFKRAQESIYMAMYALTDAQLISLLNERAKGGVATTVLYDPSATAPFENKHFFAYPVHLSGALMHRKIVVIDQAQVFLGSANLTTQSLKMHDNLVVGFYHKELARFLKNCPAPSFSFSLGKQEGELWLLPDWDGVALQRILTLIKGAKKKIFLALFTLTHPTLTEALITAHQRGVDVRIAIDFYTARGASLQALKRLEQASIPFYSSQGQQLLHHKWAWIDSSTLVFGSANWTQAAFTHNEDYFMILSHLSHKQKRHLKKIWKVIEKESI